MEESAVIDWVNTFNNLTSKCYKLEDLRDGTMILQVLAEISPDHFDRKALSVEANGNWVLCTSNLKNLLRLIDQYYKTVLKKKVDIKNVDVQAIAQGIDTDALLDLFELVVGAAVMCEAKAKFIQNIFALNHQSQTVLKGLVEQAMQRMQPFDASTAAADDDETTHNDDNTDFETVPEHDSSKLASDNSSMPRGSDDRLLRTEEMARHLHEERQRLLGVVSQLEESNAALLQQVGTLQSEVQTASRDKAVFGDANANHQWDRERETLQTDLNDSKRELDLKMVEVDSLKTDLKASKQRVDALREVQAKLEMEMSQISDELDLSRDRGLRLVKAEAQIEKYQQRLEEMVNLKKQNKEFTERMDQYLDQIHDLESSTRGTDTLNKLLEEYKVKNLKLETEKFEAMSESQVRDHEIKRLNAELTSTTDAKRFVEDELQNARDELAAAAAITEAGAAAAATDDDGEGGLFEVETVASLREKLRRAERDLAATRSSAPLPAGGGASSADLALLQAELDDTRRTKQEREDALLAAKKQLMEVQSDLHKMTRVNHELEQRQTAGADSKAAATALKEQETKLAQTTNIIKLLEEKMKEKESVINRLEQEKGKLESYAKRTLTAFKEKYMAALQGMKQEKRDLEDRLAAVTARAEANQETGRREERLLLGAMYDLGLRIMDKKIQHQISGSDPLTPGVQKGQTVLGQQRARLERQGLGTPSNPPTGSAATGGTIHTMSTPSKSHTPSKLSSL